MGGGQNCEGCEDCKTTLAQGPEGHRELQPHEWKIRYNESTGKPYSVCLNCMELDEESYKKSKIVEEDAHTNPDSPTS